MIITVYRYNTVSAYIGLAVITVYALGKACLYAGGFRSLGLLVILTAVCNTILTQIIPSSWALIVSTLVCTFAGMFFVELDDDTVQDEPEVTA